MATTGTKGARPMRYSPLVLSIALVAVPAWARDEDQQLWLKSAVSVGLGDRTKLDFDVESRFSNDSNGLDEVELGGMVTYAVAKGVTLGGGYVRSIDYLHGDVSRTEDRLRAHFGVSGTIGPARLSGRVRLEHRQRSDGDDAGFRLRPQIKATLPVGGPFSLVASHESFILLNDTDWGQRTGYQRMRNFAGVTWRASGRWSVEAGYMNQYDFGRNRASNEMTHALSVSAMLNL
ncbi:hypothetical protein CSC74_12815 [Pseudoxanthomonas yeongjuensis]|nr:hypothetical protein CSC74_12815 [Pseudoxanthomonas yeongjuensis]